MQWLNSMMDQIMRFDVNHLSVVKIRTKSSQSKKKSSTKNSMHINDMWTKSNSKRTKTWMDITSWFLCITL